MKQLCTLLLVICAGLSPVFGQKWPPSLEALLKNPSIPNQGRTVDYRDDFPVLYSDSSFTEDRNPQTQEVSRRVYERTHYNATNKVIGRNTKTDFPPFSEGNWLRTSYELDNLGQEVSSLTIEDFGGGNLDLHSRTTSFFNPSNQVIERLSERYPFGDWINEYRNLYDYGTTYDRRETYQYWVGNDWENQTRITQTNNDDGQQAYYQSETWDISEGNWKKTYEVFYEYDSNGNITQFQNKSGDPFQWNSRWVYHYDAQGKNDYYTVFTWNATLNDWVKSQSAINEFDANDVLTETVTYNVDALGIETLYSKRSFTYNEGIFSESIKSSINLIWNAITQSFENDIKFTVDYDELPNDKAKLLFDYSIKSQFNPQDWAIVFNVENFYHIGDNVSSPELQALKPCQAPNPYPIGHRVACDGLHENGSYMLWIYDAQGKMAYARHFLGSSGWSIHQALPTGTYIAVITQNGNRISSQRIVLAK